MPEFGAWAHRWWMPVLFIIVAGHITNVCVTLFLHRAQTQRCGGVVQTQHIGRDVHHHRTHGRMVHRYVGKEPAERRPQRARERQNRTLIGH